MAESTDKIILHKETHAIEVANFIVALGHKIDIDDIHRFEDQREHLGSLFPSILTPYVYELKLGDPLLRTVRQDGSALHRKLSYFGHDGSLEWAASFGDNRIITTCRNYTRWDEVWPLAKERIDALLKCIDPYKPVQSVDFGVTDTFRAKKDDAVLIPSIIFKENDFIANHILSMSDPRWDFNQGWFAESEDTDQILVRVEGRGGIQNDLVVTSISNLHSRRFGSDVKVGGLLCAEDQIDTRVNRIFEEFHNKNKRLLRKLLADDLLTRMKLKENTKQR